MLAQSKLRRAAAAAFVICTLLTLIFIFGNSLEGSDESGEKSGRLFAFLNETLGLTFLTHHIVRKIAHVVEFSLLGFFAEGVFLIALNLIFKKYIGRISLVFTVLFGLITALLDETVQIFSERGSRVTDAWIDFSGVMLGSLTCLLLYFAFRHFLANHIVKKRGDKKTNGQEK